MKSFLNLIILVVLFLSYSCTEKETSKVEKDFNDYAKFFRISGDQLTVFNPEGSDSIHFYKQDIDVSKIAIQSTTQLAFLEEFGKSDLVAAIPYANYICHSVIINKLNEGTVREILSGDAMNIEFIVIDEIKLMLLGDYADYKNPKVNQIRSFNVASIPILDWKEVHPLARAEWIKVIGWMLNEETKANKIFQSIERKYMNLKDSLVYNISLKDRPKVFSGISHKDNWFIPGGHSYLAQLIRDAGGSYLFETNEDIGSFHVSFEHVFMLLNEADILLASVNTRSMYELVSRDLRVDKADVVKHNKVFGNGKQVCQQGGNKYWSEGVVKPDRILRDLYEVFHGDDKKTYFLQKLR